MKHVGLNVAADPLFTAAYTGVAGGLVVSGGRRPGHAQFARTSRTAATMRARPTLPMLEPSDSQEAYDFTRLAFALSEQFDTPVLLRTTTRLSHGKSGTTRRAGAQLPAAVAPHDPTKYVMIPALRAQRHLAVEDRLLRLQTWAEQRRPHAAPNIVDMSVGIITSGMSYQYVREVAPEASVLKLGMVYPLPLEAIRAFAARVETLYVVEELDPFIEGQLRAAGIAVLGKEKFPAHRRVHPRYCRRRAGDRCAARQRRASCRSARPPSAPAARIAASSGC